VDKLSPESELHVMSKPLEGAVHLITGLIHPDQSLASIPLVCLRVRVCVCVCVYVCVCVCVCVCVALLGIVCDSKGGVLF
jgi:hypothetical protein